MSVIKKSARLISENRLSDALDVLTEAIASEPSNPDLWYNRGKINWRLGRHSEAMTDYEHAVALDPDSKARHALEIARDVTDYFNPDLLNP